MKAGGGSLTGVRSAVEKRTPCWLSYHKTEGKAADRFRRGFPGWRPLTQAELFVEMERFLEKLELTRSVFRSDHASNWLVLKGVLGAEKERFLREVDNALHRPESARLRPSWQRGL